MNQTLQQLRTNLAGEVLAPEDAGFAQAVQIWNGMINKTPAVMARCKSVDDVIKAVNFARQEGLPVSVRGGGHHVAGTSLIEKGLVIDLSEMRNVTVDTARSTARADGGATIADLDRATQEHGLAVPMGVVSETGVAGLTLGGGIGWMRRKHGMSADNLLAADVVLADGRLVRASSTENADLLWALRGGGWDLGVVVGLEYQAYPLGPEVWVSLVGYPWSEASQVIRNFRQFTETAPEGFNALCVAWTVPELDAFPRESWGQPFIVVVGPYAGSVEEGKRETQPLLSLGTVLGDASGVMSWVEAQSALFDEDYPTGDRYYWRSTYLRELSDDAIQVLLEMTEKRPSLRSSLDMWRLGGAISRFGPETSAAGHRDAQWLIGIEANWSDPAEDAANIAWTRETSEKLAPFSTGGSYMNFEDPDDPAATAASHGDALARLREVKRKYDPDNLFRSRKGLLG